MKRIPFIDKRTNKHIAVVRTCPEFMALCESVALRDRSFIIGKPYGNAFGVVLFQNPWTGKINPFWVKIFNCLGPEITLPAARDLFKSQLPIPLDRRPSQNQESKRKIPRPGTPKRPKRTKTSYQRMKPDTDYSRNGDCKYQNIYVQAAHLVSFRTTTKTSVKTPNFKLLSKRSLPWSNYDRSITEVTENPGYSYDRYNDGSTSGYYGYVRGQTYTGYTPTNIRDIVLQPLADTTANAALSKCLSRAKASSVNLAQMYAERRQTVSLMTSSVNRLVNLALALKKGNLKAATELVKPRKGRDVVKKHSVWNETGTVVVGRQYSHVRKPQTSKGVGADSFANLWLEFQYGWRPLLSDIYGSAELLANTYYLPKRTKVSAVADQDDRVIFSNGQWESITRVRRNHSRVVFEFQEATDLSNVFSSTGISNPALLAWELLPYSFVIDWFLPIGNYLSNLDATVGLNFIRGSTSTKRIMYVNSKLVSTLKTSPPHYCESVVLGHKEIKSRRIYTTVPLPPLPTFEPKLGSERFLSGLSLLTQLFLTGKTSVRL